jgi:hypothetical protein
VGGTKLRLRFSNAFGDGPLVLRSDVVAPSRTGKDGTIDLNSQVQVMFHGSPSAMIPSGAEYLSDAVSMTVTPLSDLTVTLFIERAPYAITTHSASRATTFPASGNHLLEERFSSPETFTRWYFLAAVDVRGTANAGAVVAFGDSITDGHARSEADRNALNQWIRTSGIFDAVIDFDKAIRDPAHPDRLDPGADSGDHLHPGRAGYKRMGELIPLDLFGQAIR